MKKGRISCLALLSLLSLNLLACAPNEEDSKESSEFSSNIDTRIPVTGISLTIDKETLYVGDSATLSVTILPENATNREYVFSTDAPNKIRIEGNQVTALETGEVQISAQSKEGKFISSVKLTIQERRNTVSDEQFLENIHRDVYSTGEYPTSEEWGLMDAGNVGVNKERLETESLYPVPTENVTTYLASDAGISENGNNNAGKLTNLINSLSEKEGTKVIRFQKGTYYFGNSITGLGVKDCYLVGEEGTKFVFTGWMSFIVLTQCENFHINNIVFDINPSPTITGTIAKCEEDSSNGYIYLKPDEGYDLTNSEYQKYNLKKTGSYAEYYFDEEYQAYVPDRSGNLFYNPGLTDLSYNSTTDLLKVTLSKSFFADTFKTPEIGTIAAVAFQVYENHGFYFKECINTYMENVTTYTVGGMGLRTDGGKNLYLNRVNFIREPGSKRLLTCTADILHTCNLEGDAIFTNCILEGSHDDAVNVKSFYTTISAIKGNVVTVNQTQSETTIQFSVGDKVDIYDPTGMKYKNTYTVTAVDKIGTSYDLTLDRSVPSRGNNSYVGFSLGNATKAVHLTMDNCVIKNKRNRGILLQGRDSVIKNCTFSNVNMGAIQILGVDDTFKEAIVPENVKVYNTKFLNCWDDLHVFTWDKNGDSTMGTLKNVDIFNNFFYHDTGTTMKLKGVGNINVMSNLFYESSSKNYSCRVDFAQDVLLKDNVTYFDTNKIGYNFASQTSNNENISMENNTLKGAL